MQQMEYQRGFPQKMEKRRGKEWPRPDSLSQLDADSSVGVDSAAGRLIFARLDGNLPARWAEGFKGLEDASIEVSRYKLQERVSLG
jgi:hypothetical protein